MITKPFVFVVDDDPAMRHSLQRLLESVDLRVRTFRSAQEFLDAWDPECPGCLVVDVRMPGMSGVELLEHMAAQPISPPVIIVTGHGDVPMAVKAIKRGALDFIDKPYSAQALLDRIQEALQVDAANRKAHARRRERIQRLAGLTPRERQVMEMLVAGLGVKRIAAELGLSHKTVQVHRAHIMEKTQAQSLPELVHLAEAVADHQPALA